jgi:hypothetical protein
MMPNPKVVIFAPADEASHVALMDVITPVL